MTKRISKTEAAAEVAPATNVTVAMFARATGINPKTLRAKLRRIARKTDSAIKHTHKEQWVLTPEIAQACGHDYEKAVAGVTEFFAKQQAA